VEAKMAGRPRADEQAKHRLSLRIGVLTLVLQVVANLLQVLANALDVPGVTTG
jgi:hypothetical protein